MQLDGRELTYCRKASTWTYR